MPVAELPAMMTEKQVAEFTGLKPQTFSNWRVTRTGGPAFVKLSERAVRYRREDVERWLDERRVDPSGKN